MRNFRNEGQDNPIDEAQLNAALESPKHARLRRLVAMLPEDTASLQWRSALNEKLLALQPVAKRLTWVAFTARALAGVALASVVAALLFINHQPAVVRAKPAVDPGAFASALISEHRQSEISSEIGGLGVADGTAEHPLDTETGSVGDTDSDSL